MADRNLPKIQNVIFLTSAKLTNEAKDIPQHSAHDVYIAFYRLKNNYKFKNVLILCAKPNDRKHGKF